MKKHVHEALRFSGVCGVMVRLDALKGLLRPRSFDDFMILSAGRYKDYVFS